MRKVMFIASVTPFTDTIDWTGGSGPTTSEIQRTSTQSTGTTATTIGQVISGRFAGDAAQRVVDIISLPYPYADAVEALEQAGLGTGWLRSVCHDNAAALFTICRPSSSGTCTVGSSQAPGVHQVGAHPGRGPAPVPGDQHGDQPRVPGSFRRARPRQLDRP